MLQCFGIDFLDFFLDKMDVSLVICIARYPIWRSLDGLGSKSFV